MCPPLVGDGRPGCGVSNSVGDGRTVKKKMGLRNEERKYVRRSSREGVETSVGGGEERRRPT